MFERPLATIRGLFLCLVVISGCDKTDHESLDKWTRTHNGAAKIKKAFADESIDPDLSAHAGANLIKMGLGPDLRSRLDQMSENRRNAVLAKMTPRLWEQARVDGDLKLPSPPQVVAKDALFTLRKYADEQSKKQIDSYLIEWYSVASYEGRAQTGAILGASVVRTLGLAAAPKLMQVLDGLIAGDDKAKKKNRIGDELMLALAASGSPDALKKLLELARAETGDETLPTRAMSAAYKAYVDPGGLFDLVGPAPVEANLDAIVAIARDDSMPGGAANDAVRLVRVVGPPACLAPLVAMIGHPHRNPRFKYVAADSALKCGGSAAIKDVVRALPSGPYQQEELVGAIVTGIAAMKPRAPALQAVRELLADRGWVARWVAVEALAAMESKEDIHRLEAVTSRDRLVGYWGDQSELDPKERKPEPTLAERARELAARLTPLK